MSESSFRPGPEQDWEHLLHQLRQQTATAPTPPLYGRVRARLVARQTPLRWFPAWLRRPAYALALGLLGLAVSGDGAAATPSGRPTYPVLRALP